MMDISSVAEIQSVVIYGSYARGDADDESDVDVCVFTSEKMIVEEKQVSSFLPIPQNNHLSLTAYCQDDLTAMLEYGSLFLWHIKLEGRIVYGEEYLVSQLANLKPFRRHHSEIAYYFDIFSDLISTSCSSQSANEFDLALLFTIVRNTCMVLTHKAGVPAFGRYACYNEAARVFQDLPISKETYLKLSKWKMVYERGTVISSDLLPSVEMKHLLAQVQDLLEYADANTN